MLLVDAAGLSSPHVFQATRRRNLTAAYVSVRGRGETFWNDDVLHSDYLILGTPLLGRRAYDLAQARHALRSVPSIEDRPVVAVALGSEAALVTLVAQATLRPFDAVVAGPLLSSYLEATTRELGKSAYVHRMLWTADIAHFIHLARDRPLFVTLTSGVGEARWPRAFEGLTSSDSKRLGWEEAIDRALKLSAP